MAFSPIKTTPGFSRRRRRPGLTWLWLILLAAGLYFGWKWFFGFDAAVESAAKAIQRGQTQQAAAKLAELNKKRPDNPQITEALGFLENHLGREEAARNKYMEAITLGLNEKNALDHLPAAQAFLDQGRYAQALTEYQHSLNLNPDRGQALVGMGWCLASEGKFHQALDHFERAIAADASLQKARAAADWAKEAITRGTHFYMTDTEGTPLARAHFDRQGFNDRSYQLAQYATHIVGVDTKRLGKFGLERDLEELFPQNTVELTINSRLQRLVAKHMGWRKGAVVVLDPKTGDILAAVNQPSFDPNDADKDYYKIIYNRNKPQKHRAFEGLYEPGSICKIITAAAALETHVDLSKIFPKRNPPAVKFDGKWFRDWKDHGKINSLKEAMDVSSNIALAYVGFALGADRHYEYTNRFGFGRKIDLGFDIPGRKHFSVEVAQSQAPLAGDDKYSLAERSCGLGKDYRITPLHAAMLAAAVANQGVMMKPRLIKKVTTINGATLAEVAPQPYERVISEETASRLKEIMIDAVEHGIGEKAQVPGVKVAGKTGTSRTVRGKQLDAWFICFAPAHDPQVAIAVLGDQEGQGMHIAAPIAGAILKDWVR